MADGINDPVKSNKKNKSNNLKRHPDFKLGTSFLAQLESQPDLLLKNDPPHPVRKNSFGAVEPAFSSIGIKDQLSIVNNNAFNSFYSEGAKAGGAASGFSGGEHQRLIAEATVQLEQHSINVHPDFSEEQHRRYAAEFVLHNPTSIFIEFDNDSDAIPEKSPMRDAFKEEMSDALAVSKEELYRDLEYTKGDGKLQRETKLAELKERFVNIDETMLDSKQPLTAEQVAKLELSDTWKIVQSDMVAGVFAQERTLPLDPNSDKKHSVHELKDMFGKALTCVSAATQSRTGQYAMGAMAVMSFCATAPASLPFATAVLAYRLSDNKIAQDYLFKPAAKAFGATIGALDKLGVNTSFVTDSLQSILQFKELAKGAFERLKPEGKMARALLKVAGVAATVGLGVAMASPETVGNAFSSVSESFNDLQAPDLAPEAKGDFHPPSDVPTTDTPPTTDSKFVEVTVPDQSNATQQAKLYLQSISGALPVSDLQVAKLVDMSNALNGAANVDNLTMIKEGASIKLAQVTSLAELDNHVISNNSPIYGNGTEVTPPENVEEVTPPNSVNQEDLSLKTDTEIAKSLLNDFISNDTRLMDMKTALLALSPAEIIELGTSYNARTLAEALNEGSVVWNDIVPNMDAINAELMNNFGSAESLSIDFTRPIIQVNDLSGNALDEIINAQFPKGVPDAVDLQKYKELLAITNPYGINQGNVVLPSANSVINNTLSATAPSELLNEVQQAPTNETQKTMQPKTPSMTA